MVRNIASSGMSLSFTYSINHKSNPVSSAHLSVRVIAAYCFVDFIPSSALCVNDSKMTGSRSAQARSAAKTY
jgi:hypothetical protein